MVLIRAQAVLITRTDKTQWYHFLLAISLPYMLNGAKLVSIVVRHPEFAKMRNLVNLPPL